MRSPRKFKFTEILLLTCPALFLAAGGFFLSLENNTHQTTIVKTPAPKPTPIPIGSYLSVKELKVRKPTEAEKDYIYGLDTIVDVTLWYAGPVPPDGQDITFRVGGNSGLRPALVDSNGKEWIFGILTSHPSQVVGEFKRSCTYSYKLFVRQIPYEAGQVVFKHQAAANYSKEIPISVVVRPGK